MMAENRKEVSVMVKSSLSKFTYLSIILGLSLSLVACGQTKKESTAVSSSGRISKSSQDSTIKNNSSSQNIVSSKDTETSSSPVTEKNTNLNEEQTTAPIVPAMLVGTWEGTSPQSDVVTLTVSTDGTIRSQANFGGFKDMDDVEAIARAVKVGQDRYRWELISGSYNALLPGITGIGGTARKAEPGFTLEGGKYTPILFTGPLDQPIDYSKAQPFGFSLTKK